MGEVQLLVLFLFKFFLGSADTTYPCPTSHRVYYCANSTVVYMFDASTDLPDGQIQAQFNFTRYNIIPVTAYFNDGFLWYSRVALGIYGSGTDYGNDFSGYLPCNTLDRMQNDYLKNGSRPDSLVQALTVIYKTYHVTNVVLYSGSKDLEDIRNAADFARNNMPTWNFTVIALGGSLITEFNFPATVYHVADLNNPPSDLGPCIMHRSCGYTSNCTINENPGSVTGETILPRSSTSSTAITPGTPTTKTPTTFATFSPKPSTTTAAPSAPPSSSPSTASTSPHSAPSTLQCQCDTMSAWLDIIFVIDASASTGQSGLDEMWGMAGTMLDFFNVQKTGYTASNYTSRVGIITYGNSATVLYPLGSLDNDDIDNLFDLPFNNDPMANLEAGIQAAVGQFNGPNHRSNAREVIIVMAAAFNPEGENAPNKTATTFKENGGVLMVFNYVPEHGVESPVLASLASPGYFFSTTLNSRNEDLMLGLCDANCFCRDLLHPYGLSNPRGYPTQGCYAAISADTNYPRANNNCKLNYYDGTVAADEDPAKTVFLKALFSNNNPFYIGLIYDNIEKRWQWPDGITPGNYQPWVGGRVPDGSSQQCVYVDFNSQWQATDCRNGQSYVCEIRPCDSVNYCG